jgi:hypothetical protein
MIHQKDPIPLARLVKHVATHCTSYINTMANNTKSSWEHVSGGKVNQCFSYEFSFIEHVVPKLWAMNFLPKFNILKIFFAIW